MLKKNETIEKSETIGNTDDNQSNRYNSIINNNLQ